MSRFDYSSQFGTAYHSARRLPAPAEQWIAQLRSEKLAQWIAPMDRVLEYGVGFGWNLAELKCHLKVGFDLAPELRQAVESKGIQFETSEDRLEPYGYDIVLAHHVLEHVQNPSACLQLLKSLLRPSGRLLLFVPFECEQKYRRQRRKDLAHHLFSWTPASLSHLVSASGWRIERAQLQPFRFDRIAAIIAARAKANFRMYRWLRAVGLLLFPEHEISLAARPN